MQQADPATALPTLYAPGLDVLRGGAALAVVFLHACVPYLRHPMPGLLWPVRDESSEFADVAFWAIEVFIMPVFLVMAGFFLWRSAQKASPIELIRGRGKRLLIPLLFGLLVVLPADMYIWTMGLVSEGVVSAVKLKSLKFESPISEQIWGLSHLWFLLYTFLYVVIFAALVNRQWIDVKRRWSRIQYMRSLAGIVVIGTATLLVAPEVVWGFQHAFLPVSSKWIYSGAFFALGWCLASHDPDFSITASRSRQYLAYGVIALVSAVSMGRWSLDRQLHEETVSYASSLLLASTTVAAATLMTLGLIGVAVSASHTLLQVKHARLRRFASYLSAASFWIYLVHHPMLGLVHLDLKWLFPGMPAVVKLTIAFGLVCVLSLASYEFVVKRTSLGIWLGFTKPRSRDLQNGDIQSSTLMIPATESHPGRRAA